LFQPSVDPEVESRSQTARLVSQINRTLINSLIADCPHLAETDTDIDPRHEAFWFFGGIEPPERIRKMRKNSWQKDYADDPVDRNIQYTGKPLLTLRHSHPLESPLEFEQFSTDDLSKVPEFKLDPTTVGYSCDYRPATTIPGINH
jgi:small subunit ribosomal protein S30